MIKEKKKKKKKEELTLSKELAIYIKTAVISFAIAAIIAVLMSFHARTEMIKNLYSSKSNKAKIEKQVAQQIVSHSDLISSLHNKNYAVMVHVGTLYEAAGDYAKAEYAYHLATQKSPNYRYLAFKKLAIVLISQGKIADAEEVLNSIEDVNNINLIRFKTRVYIVLGDKYYSEGKFLKAADAYEKANYYYNRLKKKDKYVRKSIYKRLVNSYLEAASVIVKNGYNSDAVRFLKKALKYDPDNLKIQYRLAIVYADLDPIVSIEYFEPLIAKIPQEIDYNTFSNVLIKAANIMDLEGNAIKAKYYRYKIHSLDMYINRKVVYNNEVNVILNSFIIKKTFLKYKLKANFTIKNISSQDITKMAADFVLRQNDEEKERIEINCASKKKPLFSNGGAYEDITIKFDYDIFTKRELGQYYVDVYLYKVPKYKTLVGTFKVPNKSYYGSKTRVSPHL